MFTDIFNLIPIVLVCGVRYTHIIRTNQQEAGLKNENCDVPP